MKKVFLIGLMLFGVLNGLLVSAENAGGYVYSTDILTYVNASPIQGYNIGGKTVIVAEDLLNYGFNVEYSDATRTLKIVSFFNRGNPEFQEIKRSEGGNIIGKIYNTDIKVYYNGLPIRGYNLGGKTAICLEDLGDLSDSPNREFGYSKYLGKCVWNPVDRTISYDSYQTNTYEILGVSRVYHRFKDNVIYTFADDYYSRSEFCALEEGEFTGVYTYSAGVGMSKYNLKPLYFDNHGELVPVGLCVCNPNHNQNEALLYIEDPTSVKAMIKSYKTPQMTHDEAVLYFENRCEIQKKIENDSYTVFMAKHETEGLVFVYINKNGGFVVDDFLSGYSEYDVDIWFDETADNTVIHTVSPFAGPHGATTMQYASNLDSYDYD